MCDGRKCKDKFELPRCFCKINLNKYKFIDFNGNKQN